MNKRSGKDDIALYELEIALEKEVISQIRKRQSKIPGLKQDALGYTAIWGDGQMTPGCKDCCLKGRWTQIRTTTRCNLNCRFCYYFSPKHAHSKEFIPEDRYLIFNRLFSESDVKLLFEVQGQSCLSGIAWLHFEPLMKLDKILPLMRFIREKGYHQWLYTNGLLATKKNLKRLGAAGLDEIRFNLAATNCSDAVIDNLAQAREYFKYLCIESPMSRAFYESFMKKRHKILATGVDHINFAELQVFTQTKDSFKNEGPLYRYKMGYVSPIKSRHLTYDLFELAAKERWKGVVLHDCSNETKFFRGAHVPSQSGFGTVYYRRYLNLDNPFYQEALSYLKARGVGLKPGSRKLLSNNNDGFADPVLLYPVHLSMETGAYEIDQAA